MAKVRPRRQDLPVMQPDAAGIDIGAEEVFVAVPPDRDTESVRHFRTFTRDLHEMAEWLKHCGVRCSVAMESTGVYWIPVSRFSKNEVFEVYLVNAQSVKHVPGRKTDVCDCQWIQHPHSVGLLRASFRPRQRFRWFVLCGDIGTVSYKWPLSTSAICKSPRSDESSPASCPEHSDRVEWNGYS